MKIIFFIWINLLLFAHSAACIDSQDAVNSGDEIAASVGEIIITKQEYTDYLLLYRKTKDFKKVAETLTPEGKERILNELIEQHLLVLEAKSSGLDKKPLVQQEIQKAIENVLAQSFIKMEIGRVNVSDESLIKYYNLNPEPYTTGIRIKAKHIITKTNKEAEKALQEVNKGKEFSTVAEQVNIDSSQSTGGDLGWVVKGIMVKPFEDALFSLEESQVSGIVKTSFGFHIIKAEKIVKGKIKPFNSVKNEVKKQIVDQHISQLKENLTKKYPIKINRDLLINKE